MTVIIITLLAIYLIYPTKDEKSKLNLGLDLSGGIHLLLEVDFDKYMMEKYIDVAYQAKKLAKLNQFRYNNVLVNEEGVKIHLLPMGNKRQEYAGDNTNDNNFKKQLNEFDSDLNINEISTSTGGKNITLKYDDRQKAVLLNKIIDQSIATLRTRVDNTGTKEPILQKQGDKRIILEMPGLISADSLKNAIGKTAKLTFHIVEEQDHFDNKTLKTQQGEELIIKTRPELSGEMLESTSVVLDEYSRPTVSFKLNSQGTKLFAELTAGNLGRRLAIVLDDVIITAPSINTPIKEGGGVITGNFTIEEANELVDFLKAGSLVAKLDIVEERIIGPTLGEKSIHEAKIAGIVALLLVMAFMLFYYRVLGIFANISLLLSLLYMFAMLSVFGATLTMPGIAGIILTIGIAVDANILIFERIKEEFKATGNLVHSVRTGFKFAFNTIIDSNITTLIVAFLLYIYGTGPIRGFAVTLTVGIIASMFSAIVVTKLIIDIWLKTASHRKDIKL